MIKTKKQGLLIIISGPSGAGKGTICKKLLEEEKIWLSISTTTRNIRQGETDGVDYFFVSKEIFENKIKNGEFLEYATVHHNNYYGTSKKDVQKHLNDGEDVILEIDIEGAFKVKEKVEEAICIFILPPNMKELKKRLLERNTETKEQIIERFKKAYKEINEVTKYNYVVINDEVFKAVSKIKAIIMAEKCRVDRIEEVLVANAEEEMHELLMDNKDFINEKIEL